MTIFTLLAEVSAQPNLPDLHVALSVAAGVVAGLTVAGVLHSVFLRARVVREEAPVAKPAAPGSGGQEVADPGGVYSGAENRKSFRRQGNPVEVLVVNQRSNAPAFKGYVIDRSVGGLGLLLQSPLEKGTQLTVWPVNAPHTAPWVEIIVRGCRQLDSGWEIGCQFVKTPPWSILLMFG
jgi:hypothetical protein